MMNVLSGLIRATDTDFTTYHVPGRLPGVREEEEEREGQGGRCGGTEERMVYTQTDRDLLIHWLKIIKGTVQPVDNLVEGMLMKSQLHSVY